jgi:hypothetical protein
MLHNWFYFFCSENGQITGNVLVYRNPGLHFGDIHIMQAYVVNCGRYRGASRRFPAGRYCSSWSGVFG